MGKLKQILELIEDSSVFKNWKDNHNTSYLCAFFRTVGNTDNPEWQVHYYQPENDTISVFSVGNEVKIVEEDSEILKNKEDKVKELNLDEVKIDFIHALEITDQIDKKYSNETITKRIVILQKLNKIVWNVTYMTGAFNLLNVKVDAATGEVIEESKTSLLKKSEGILHKE